MIKTINNILNKSNFEIYTRYFNTNINKNNEINISSSTLKFLMKIKIKNLNDISNISSAVINLENDLFGNDKIDVQLYSTDLSFDDTSIELSDLDESIAISNLIDSVTSKMTRLSENKSIYEPITDEIDITKLVKNKTGDIEETVVVVLNKGKRINYKFYDPEFLFIQNKNVIELRIADVKGISKMYHYDEYDYSSAGKVMINTYNGKLNYVFNFPSTLGKKNPVSLSMVINDSPMNNSFMPYNIKFSFQYDVEFLKDNNNSLKLIRLYDCSMNGKEYRYLNQNEFETYSDLLRDYSTNYGSIYINEEDYSFIYYAESNGIGYLKLFDKYGNETYFQYENDKFQLLYAKTYRGFQSNFYYERLGIERIFDANNDEIQIVYNNDFTVNYIYYPSLNIKYTFKYLTNSIQLVYEKIDGNLSSNTVLESYTTDINFISSTGRLGYIYDSLTRKEISFSYDSIGRITNHSMSNIEGSTMRSVSYSFLSDCTCVTNFDDSKEYLYFDEYGRLITTVNDKNELKKYIYSGQERLEGFATIPHNKNSLIKNGYFEKIKNNLPTNWDIYSESGSSFIMLREEESDSRTLKCSYIANDNVIISQVIGFVEAGDYTLSMEIYEACGNIVIKDYKSLNLLNNISNDLTLNEFNSYVSGLICNEIVLDYSLSQSFSLDTNYYHYLVIELRLNSDKNISAFFNNVNLYAGKFQNSFNMISKCDVKFNNAIENHVSYEDFNTSSKYDTWETVGETISVSNDRKLSSGLNKMLGSMNICASPKATNLNNRYKTQLNLSKGDILTFSTFVKCYTSYNSYVGVVLTLFNEENNSSDSYNFIIDPHIDSWQAISNSFVLEQNYSIVYISLFNEGQSDAYFDGFQLYNKCFETKYLYDKKSNIIGQLSEFDNIKVSYNDNNRIKYITNNGNIYKYEYDDSNRLVKILDNSGNNILFEYDDDDNLIKRTVNVSSSLITSNTYNGKGYMLTNTNEYEDVMSKTYDTSCKVSKESNYNGSEFNYSYNNLDLLSKASLNIDNIEHANTLNYNNALKNYLETVTSNNGTQISTLYDERYLLYRVKMNDIILHDFEYDKKINDVNCRLITSDTDNYGNQYTYNYDDLNRLESVYVNNVLKVKYEYNLDNKINLIHDYENNIVKALTYDENGNIIKVIDNLNVNKEYFYDNRGNMQKINYNINNAIRSIDYGYSYEVLSNNRYGYLAKVSNIYKDELVLPGFDQIGNYGLYPISKNIDELTSENVIYFEKDNDYILYDLSLIKNEIKDSGYPDGTLYSDIVEKYLYTFSKTFYLWIKVEGAYSRQQMLLFKNKTSEIDNYLGSINVENDGYVSYCSYGSTIIKNKSASKLKNGEWNFVAVQFKKAVSETKTKCNIYVNGTLSTETEIDENINNINHLVVGSDEGDGTLLALKYKLCCLGFSHTGGLTKYNKIYNEGINYINNLSQETRDGSYYYNGSIYDGYEVFSLNGTVESNKGTKPLLLLKKDGTKENEKDKVFKYSVEDKKHMFVSLNNSNYLGDESPILGYSLNLTTNFILSLRFKLLDNSKNVKRYILFTEQTSLYVEEGMLYFKNLSNVTSICEVNNNIWNNLVLYYNYNGIQSTIYFYLNNELKLTTNIHWFTLLNIMVIGRHPDNSNTELDGYIEMLAHKNTSFTQNTLQSEVNKLYLYGNPISNVNTYNELGQLTQKEIKTNNILLTNSYTYNKTRLFEETILGTPFRYQYDALGNVTRISHKGSSSIFTPKISYTYDGLGRLINENDLTYTTTYTYDSNGNIQTIKKTRNLLQAQVVFEKKFNYNETYKDRLESIEYIQGTGETITLSYDEKKLYPKSIWYSTLTSPYEIEYENGRIKSYRGNSFTYNSDGVRIKKENILKTHEYTVDGNKIIKEKITANNGVHELFYNYDQYGELLSVELNGNIYFYIKDALGIIQKLVDENGNTVVSYLYTGGGKSNY